MPIHEVKHEILAREVSDEVIQFGLASVTTDGSGAATVSVSFSPNFADTPSVGVISNKSGDLTYTGLSASGVDFEIANGGSAVSHTLSWHAIFRK